MVNYRITQYFTSNQIKLKELHPLHIQEFYNSMSADGLSTSTVLRYHAIIRKSLDYAFKMDMIVSNPADKVEKPKPEQFIVSFYNDNELKILFEKSKNDPLELVIFLTAFYGLRRSEVLGLKWSAIDFEKKTITIRHKIIQVQNKIIGKNKTKNRTSYRTLPLVDDVTCILLQFKDKQLQNQKICGKSYNNKYEEYICVDDLGNIIKPDYVTKHFKIVLKNNNLREIRFHDLRHSCASLLLARGVHMKEIQEWLGHSSFKTTADIYAHIDVSAKQNSVNILSNVFTKQKKRIYFRKKVYA